MIDDLLKIFSNCTRSLEILYLLEDAKKSVRLDANEIEFRRIKDFCLKSKLHVEVSDFKVVKVLDAGKGSYSNMVKTVPINSGNQGLFHLYLSKEENTAKFLKLLEAKNDDRAIGEILGYPKCCVDFFVKNKEKQLQNDFILPALANSEGFQFPFYANHAARYFDTTLLSHFPHSFNCEESITIAKKNLSTIKKYSPSFAQKFMEKLRNTILYTETDGIFMLKSYLLDDDMVKFNEVFSTAKNNIYRLLNAKKKIKMINKNKVIIGDKVLDGIGIIVFS